MLTALGFGLWLSALNVRYRDVNYLVPFLVQTWMYLTPVIYGATLLPEQFRWLLALNPMSLVVEGLPLGAAGPGRAGHAGGAFVAVADRPVAGHRGRGAGERAGLLPGHRAHLRGYHLSMKGMSAKLIDEALERAVYEII